MALDHVARQVLRRVGDDGDAGHARGSLSSGRMAPAVLYRCKTPTNRLCACGRVARELARRGIEAEERRVPWRRGEREEVEALTGQTRRARARDRAARRSATRSGSSSTCAGATMSGNAPALSITAVA